MASQTLSRQACERFFSVRNALAEYAYDKLDFEDDDYYFALSRQAGQLDFADDQMVAEVLQYVWKNPGIIDDFVRQNPAGLDLEDLAAVQAWRTPLPGLYTAFSHAGKVMLLEGNFIFEVTGLSVPVGSIVDTRSAPKAIHTTLLPFDGKIVYDGFFQELPIRMGEELARMFDDDVKRALVEAERVSSAQRLAELAPGIQQERIEKEAQLMLDDLELAQRADEQAEGFHRGVLAGMSEEEREAAVREYMHDEVLANKGLSRASLIKKDAIKGAPTRELGALISREPKLYLQRWAKIYGCKASSKSTKAQLVQELVPALQEHALLPFVFLRSSYSSKQLAAYRALFEAGGMMQLSEEDLTDCEALPSAVRMLCYVFFELDASIGKGTFTFVIPEELMGILGTFDWGEIQAHAAEVELACSVVEALCELRGIVGIAEAYGEYVRHSTAPLAKLEFEQEVYGAIEDELIGCRWLFSDNDTVWLLAYDLGWYYQEQNYEADDQVLPFMEGPLEDLGFLLEQQEGKVPRALDEDMLGYLELLDWKLSLPAVRAVRNYLDEHVPDGQDDYMFADSVVEDMVGCLVFGLDGANTLGECFRILEDHGFIPDVAYTNRLLELLMNMVNALPCWMNNGWSPNEMLEESTGRKQFFNEDGSVMKVGRNDPCPCGSGKKYKHCCGKRS